MNTIEIYTRPGCSYCLSAKRLLNNRDLDFVEYNVFEDSSRLSEMLERSTQRSFPQIIIDDQAIGGFDELAALVRQQSLCPNSNTATYNFIHNPTNP